MVLQEIFVLCEKDQQRSYAVCFPNANRKESEFWESLQKECYDKFCNWVTENVPTSFYWADELKKKDNTILKNHGILGMNRISGTGIDFFYQMNHN